MHFTQYPCGSAHPWTPACSPPSNPVHTHRAPAGDHRTRTFVSRV